MSKKTKLVHLLEFEPNIHLSKIENNRFADQFAEILNSENQIGEKETAESVLAYLKNWCETRKAKFFLVILEKDEVIGSISLSRINLTNGTARVGYMISKDQQNKGYGTSALINLIEKAKTMGLKELSSTIDKKNIASFALWKNAGYQIVRDNEEIKVSIK